MPIEYTIDVARGLIHTRGWDYIGDKEYRAYIANLFADPAVRPGMKQLTDWRAVTQVDVSAETMRATAETVRAFVERQHHQPNFTNYRLAIVVAQTVVYGMARMYQILSEEHDPHIGVFRDIDEARAWLGLAPSDD
jgi:hypothetical protein